MGSCPNGIPAWRWRPLSYVAIGEYRYDGEWEQLMPQRVRAVELPEERKEVRAALTQALEDQAARWEDKVRRQTAAGGSGGQAPVHTEASARAPDFMAVLLLLASR